MIFNDREASSLYSSTIPQIRNAGFPSEVKTEEDKRRYCEKVNEKMEFFHPDLKLTVANVCDNRQLRDAFKLGSNSLLGKLSQDSDFDQQVNLSNQEDLDALFYDEHKSIVDIIPVSSHVIQARVKSRPGFNRPNKKGSVILGAYVTASARIEMYSYFMKCLEANITIAYTDTDSMILAVPNGVEIPVPFGNCYGEFKHEVVGNIKEFHSLGPKNYCIVAETEDKSKEFHIVKARGFYIKDEWSSREINHTSFVNLLDDYLLKETTTRKLVPQFNIRIEKKNLQLFSALSVKVFRNDVYNKRCSFRGKETSLFTMPFGYTEDMLLRRNIVKIVK